jgi:hypothetical protein
MICSKVSAGIGAIRRIRPFVSSATLKLMFNAIVQPYFDYCSPLWDNCGIGLKDSCRNFKIGEIRRNYLKSVFMYKILNDHTAPNLRTSFRLNNECDNMILEIEKPICLFLNRIPILVKDASNITER